MEEKKKMKLYSFLVGLSVMGVIVMFVFSLIFNINKINKVSSLRKGEDSNGDLWNSGKKGIDEFSSQFKGFSKKISGVLENGLPEPLEKPTDIPVEAAEIEGVGKRQMPVSLDNKGSLNK